MYLYKSEKNITKILKLDKMKKNSSLYNFKFVVIFQKVTFIQLLVCPFKRVSQHGMSPGMNIYIYIFFTNIYISKQRSLILLMVD